MRTPGTASLFDTQPRCCPIGTTDWPALVPRMASVGIGCGDARLPRSGPAGVENRSAGPGLWTRHLCNEARPRIARGTGTSRVAAQFGVCRQTLHPA